MQKDTEKKLRSGLERRDGRNFLDRKVGKNKKMKGNTKTLPRSEGFTLVELIISILIIAIALLGVVAASLKTNLLVEETKRVAKADEYIAGQMEEIRSSGAAGANDSITVSITGDSVSGVYTLTSFEIANAASHWTSSIFPGTTTRAITFYVYQKGLSWRP